MTRVGDLFGKIGETETCHQLSVRFHERLEQDQVLKAIFPQNMTRLTENFAIFLSERLGGPKAYTSKRGKQSLVCRHAHLSISTNESERWLANMFAAIDEVGIQEPAKSILSKYFVVTAQTLTDPFIPFYNLPLHELKKSIEQDSELIKQSATGHSLLRHAVSAWDEPRVRLLLESGSDPHAIEPLGHGLLYRAANSVLAGSEDRGKAVLLLLVENGADIHLRSGPGKSTPLHVAARRGNVFIAEILISTGADIEAEDSKGETPLRRAVNCRQEPMVKFLMSRGANPLSRDKKGQLPRDFAKTKSMQDALLSRY